MRRHADGRPLIFDLAARVFYLDVAGGSENCVFLAGGGRSGTTWVMEAINAERDHRVVFEPLAAHRLRFLSGFHRQHYLRPDDDDPYTAEVMDRVIHGRYRSWWTDQHNRTVLCRRRLIKSIRANLCLGYIRRRYPEMPMVLLIRHPCAAASSMLKLGYGGHPLSQFLDQPALVEDHLAPYEEMIRTTIDPFERRVVRWCIQHAVLFSQLREGDVHLMFYEELCDEPHESFAALYAHLGMPFNEPAREAVHRPSRLTGDHSEILKGAPKVDAWREGVSSEQVTRAMKILEAFGVGDVYGEDDRPDRRAVEARLRANGTRHSH